MNGTYDIGLVVLSIGVAIIASYVALDLASRIASSQETRAARYWLDGGAVSMGTGIWSMHFIGMLAFRLPIPMSYDIPITLLSLMVAIIVSGLALYTASHDVLRMNRLLSAGLCMGIGIAAMHYTGMAAMQMEPPIRYDPLLFVLSVLIAIVASMAALWIAFQLRLESILSAFWKKAGSALVMGAAISGMHYTGMAAANFDPNSICTVNPQQINNVWLAGTIGGFTFMLLSATLLISVFDARLADRSAKLAQTLRKANVELEMRTTQLTRANASLLQEARERKQAEQARANLAAIIENSNEAIISRAFDGTILSWNAGAERLFGYGAAEVIGRPIGQFIHLPEERARIAQNIERVRRGEVIAPYEARRKTKDGRVIDVLSSVSPIRNEAGEVTGASSILQDISTLKQAEATMKESEERFHAAFEQAGVGMALRDIDPRNPRWLRVNQKLCDILGYPREELLQLSSVDVTPPDERQVAIDYNEKLRRGEIATYSREKRYVRKDGRIIWTNITLTPVSGPDGRPSHIISVIQDISERKQAEETQARLVAIVENSNDPIIGRTTDGTITSWNAAAERFFGYSAAEAIGQTVASLIIPPDLQAQGAQRRVQLATGHAIPPYETERITKDGRRVPVLLSESAIRNKDGVMVGVSVIFSDITERKRAEERLSALNAELEAKVASRTKELANALVAALAADRIKVDFMANVTHELRTPLNSVIGFAELLKDEVPGPLNAKQAVFAADILASGQHLLALVEGILEMSRFDVAAAAIEREPVEIGAAIEARVAAHRKAAEDQKVHIAVEVAADTGRAELDPKALRRMLDALIDNAIKFNREGGTVAVRARRDDGWLEIAVADTGIGIAREDLAKPFKPLAQLDAGLARAHGGVGLGLALAGRLAKLHGGTIEVQSEPGKGSTFTLRLPVPEC